MLLTLFTVWDCHSMIIFKNLRLQLFALIHIYIDIDLLCGVQARYKCVFCMHHCYSLGMHHINYCFFETVCTTQSLFAPLEFNFKHLRKQQQKEKIYLSRQGNKPQPHLCQCKLSSPQKLIYRALDCSLNPY